MPHFIVISSYVPILTVVIIPLPGIKVKYNINAARQYASQPNVLRKENRIPSCLEFLLYRRQRWSIPDLAVDFAAVPQKGFRYHRDAQSIVGRQ